VKISVRVKPNSRNVGVEKISEREYLIRVKSPARGGKANHELIGLLADYFEISMNSIEIITGFGYRRKIIRIHKND